MPSVRGARVSKQLTKYGSMVKPPASDDGLVYHSDVNFSFFKKGRDVGGSHTNYEYSEQEQETLAMYDSIDYFPSDSNAFRAWITQQPHRLDLFRWVTMGIIGLAVGLAGCFLRWLIEVLSDLKMDRPREMLQESPPNIAGAWAWATGLAVIFVAISAGLVVVVAPSAASSGVPEVTAFLNGTLVRHYFNIKTFSVKFVSCILAVASGLPVGQEGPMIHIGSIIGSWLSQFKSDTLKFRVPFFQMFRNSQDRRNFISAGAAAGIATAFNAPIGGLLFSMEEVSSFWNEQLSWQIFFCCAVAVITNVLLIHSLPRVHMTTLKDVRFQDYILFQVKHRFDYNLAIFIPVVILGLLGGLLGAVYIFLNLKIHRARKKLLSTIRFKRLRRVMRFFEPVIFGAIYASLVVFLPAAFNCQKVRCAIPIAGHGNNRSGSHCVIRPVSMESNLFMDRDFDNYTCPRGVLVPERMLINNRSYPALFNNATYSPVATLMSVTGEKMIRHLFSRETYGEFEYDVLLVVLAVYFVGSCYSANMSISAGLVIPQLVIGALYGRIVGQVMVRIYGQPENGSGLSWMDPGAMSLIGAASFFGGVTRLTTSIVVLMMELTNDMQFLLPVMVAVMIAKAIGELLTHSMYRAQMNLKCIPHLISEPVVHSRNKQRLSLELFSAGDVMSYPVETVSETERLQRVAQLMLNSHHGGFPVVLRHADSTGDTFVGLITRMELMALVVKKAFLQDVSPEAVPEHQTQVPYDQLNIDRLSNPHIVEQTFHHYAHDEIYKDTVLDLRNYLNQSAMTVRVNFSLQRTYVLMRSMGIRHVTVVDDRNCVVGIITRKDLMGFNLESRLQTVVGYQRRPSEQFSIFLPGASSTATIIG